MYREKVMVVCRWWKENNEPGERRKDSAAQVQGREEGSLVRLARSREWMMSLH